MTCNVIKDLLVLYAAGECSEDTRQLIDEHLKNCENCRIYLKELTEADSWQQELSADETLKQKTEEFQVKKGLHKIRKRWILSIICVFMIFPLIITGIMIKNENRREGICFSNLDEIYQVHKYIRSIQKRDYNTAFTCLDLNGQYEYLVESNQELGQESTEKATQEQKAFQECAEYYTSMGFETYSQKQEKTFLEQIQELNKRNIIIESFDINESWIYLTENDIWTIEAAVTIKQGKQILKNGVIEFRVSADGILHVESPYVYYGADEVLIEQTTEILDLLYDVDDIFQEKQIRKSALLED